MLVAAFNDERQLQVIAYNFDIWNLKSEFVYPLRQSLILNLQYRIMVPDMTSIGSFTSCRASSGSLQCNKFRRNIKYHQIILKKFLLLKSELNLLTKWDVVFNDDKDTLTNWCNRVDQLHSGQFVDIYVNKHPVSSKFYHQYI